MSIRFVLLAAAVALAAGPAAAQGTFSPGQKPGSTFGSGSSGTAAKPQPFALPSSESATASRPRTYGAPEAPKSQGFEPYKPFAGSSVYSRQSGSSATGAKPCETSVYANACDRRR